MDEGDWISGDLEQGSTDAKMKMPLLSLAVMEEQIPLSAAVVEKPGSITGVSNTRCFFMAVLVAALLWSTKQSAFWRGQATPTILWNTSMWFCRLFFSLTLCLSRTLLGVADLLWGFSRGPLLALAAYYLIGPVPGMVVAHVGTASAAGLFGYYLAEYLLHVGSEGNHHSSGGWSEEKKKQEVRRAIAIEVVFMVSMYTLLLGAFLVWLVFVPIYIDFDVEDDSMWYVVVTLCVFSILTSIILFLWSLFLVHYLLHESPVSLDSMMHVGLYFLASIFPSTLFSLVSILLYVLYYGVVMMCVAAFVGYILAINAHCKNETQDQMKTQE